MVTRDELFNMESGDLGLGHGLLPGALSTNEMPVNVGLHPNRTVLESPVCLQTGVTPPSDSGPCADVTGDPKTAKKKNSFKLKWLRKSESACNEEDKDKKCVEGQSPAPATAVQIGTSLRQQKLLYEHDLDHIIRKNSETDQLKECIHSEGDVRFDCVQNGEKDNCIDSQCGEKVVQEKLLKAQQEINLLRQELEQCQKHLHSKYQAIEILQKQVLSSGHVPVRFREEIQKLQFELEYKQSTLLNSQELWAERFDRVCQENLSLASLLESKNNDIRSLVAEKIMLARERDELLALLDIHERQKFESSRSISSEDAYFDFTSSELALLGACHCRVSEPDPCGCSHAAVALQREINRLKCDIEIQKQRRDEALITTDAYRIAFEQQLSRSSTLLKRLAELTSSPASNKSPGKSLKEKSAIKWLLENLHEEDQSAKNMFKSVLENDADSLEEDQIILLLVDMVCDKTEALAHQRLATRMLAGKTKELESKLAATQDDVFQKEGASNG